MESVIFSLDIEVYSSCGKLDILDWSLGERVGTGDVDLENINS